MKMYICKQCGNLIKEMGTVEKTITCCNEKMEELKPWAIESSKEKHIPLIQDQDQNVIVTVGQQEHPMNEDHYIKWIMIETENGFSVEYLQPHQIPQAIFSTKMPIRAVYAYCNLHGLSKGEI